MATDIDFKASDITDGNNIKWTRLEVENSYVDIKQPYSVDELQAAIDLLRFKIRTK